jgi:hypothetical protein
MAWVNPIHVEFVVDKVTLWQVTLQDKVKVKQAGGGNETLGFHPYFDIQHN